MGDLHYMISDAAKKVAVEAHVLRYWEDELNLTIERNEMGHRYYTEDNIELFQCIKKLKEKGMLLKDLKPVIPELIKKRAEIRKASSEEKEKTALSDPKDKEADVTRAEGEVITDEKLEQVKTFISDVVTEVLIENNKRLKQEITESVTESVTEEVTHEVDVMLREKERREEEHFHKMDCLIRQQQVYRKESVKVAPIQRLKRFVMGT